MKDGIQEFKRALSIVMKDANFSESDRQKVMLQIKQKRNKTYPRWIIASVASLMIIGTGFTFGGTNIADATNTLIGQIFGSKESIKKSFPKDEVTEENITNLEEELELIKQHLSKEEFADFSQLLIEQAEITKKMVLEDRDFPNAEEERRLHEIQDKLQKYDEILEPSKHTLKEAQKMVSYPISQPSYVPKEYKLVSEEATTVATNVGKDPVITLKYSSGEYTFEIKQKKISDNSMFNLYDPVISYKNSGYNFEYGYFEGFEERNMRLINHEKGFEIAIYADRLTKEDMEKILLSMINQ